MFLFPLVGGLIGFITGLFAWALLWILPSMIVGMLTLGLLLLMTGFHHTDGLLDFADGVMFLGSPEQRIKVMHDNQTGVAGLGLGLVTLGTTALCIAHLDGGIMIQALVSSEVSAKLAMVVCARVGRSAHPGMGRLFVEAMHGHAGNLKLISALAISLITATLLLRTVGMIAVAAGVAMALTVVWIAHRNINGVTGDVIGATNDLARMAALLSVVGATRLG
jgi:adenosylcobinamide-GDP ribazoletransferase